MTAPIVKALAGSWSLVSNTIENNDGSKFDQFGPNPKGLLMLDEAGHWSVVMTCASLPRFASKDRGKGTPEENYAVVSGSLAYFGAYSIDEANRTMTVRIEGCTFPNWIGTEQKRLFTLNGEELILTNPAPSVGGGSARVVWKRAR
jgi:hypothetical protein